MTTAPLSPTDPAHLRKQVADQLDEIARLKAANAVMLAALERVGARLVAIADAESAGDPPHGSDLRWEARFVADAVASAAKAADRPAPATPAATRRGRARTKATPGG